MDSSGNLYFVDSANHRVRRISPDGSIVTVAGTGTPGFSGDFGPAVSAQLNQPMGIAVDLLGFLYIADTGNNRVRAVDLNGMIYTVAGNGNAAFFGDGTIAQSAALRGPRAVAVDQSRNLFIADTLNHRVREVPLLTGILEHRRRKRPGIRRRRRTGGQRIAELTLQHRGGFQWQPFHRRPGQRPDPHGLDQRDHHYRGREQRIERPGRRRRGHQRPTDQPAGSGRGRSREICTSPILARTVSARSPPTARSATIGGNGRCCYSNGRHTRRRRAAERAMGHRGRSVRQCVGGRLGQRCDPRAAAG